MNKQTLKAPTWHVLISSWAGSVWHPVEIIKLNPTRSTVRFLEDNIKGKHGSVHSVPTGSLRSPDLVCVV